MDKRVDQPSRSEQSTLSLVTLPVELLLYIVSFLSTRDKVAVRCTSKTLRSVTEAASLWKIFFWSRYTPRDEKLLKHVLKMFGKHVERFHFDDHLAPGKLEMMLKFCKNLVHLSLPSLKYHNFGKLEKMVLSIGNIQILDIPIHVRHGLFYSYAVDTCRQIFTLSSNCNLKELSLYYGIDTIICCGRLDDLLQEWANANYVPRNLNIIIDRRYTKLHKLVSSLQSCVPILETKPLQYTAWFNIHLNTSTNLSAIMPYVQLRITGSSVVFSSVKASSFGILGLDCDTLHVTKGFSHGKVVHKALLTGTNLEYLDTSVTSLISVTHFDASHCTVLYPGHLEQLSIACSNLKILNLSHNNNCLSNLDGLESLANNCKSLLGLCLKEVHVHDHEYDCIQLWEILSSMRLTQLGIEHCMVKINDSRNAKSVARGDTVAVKQQKLVKIFQKYSSLEVLEVGVDLYEYECHNPTELLIMNFPSITSYRLCRLPSNCHHILTKIFSSKYLRCLYLSTSGKSSLSLEGHCSSLQQVYVESRDSIPTEGFIDALCGHGGLEHVILFFKSITGKSVNSLIKQSPNLLTFRVYSVDFPDIDSEKLKAEFFKRKIFNGGSFDMEFFQSELDDVEMCGTDLLSVWLDSRN